MAKLRERYIREGFPRAPMDTDEHQACVDVGDGCDAVSDGGWLCTLNSKHVCDHIATDGEKVFDRWPSAASLTYSEPLRKALYDSLRYAGHLPGCDWADRAFNGSRGCSCGYLAWKDQRAAVLGK